MARPVVLFSGPWADLPLDELAPRASEWGYQGLDLACWGDHFEVQRALSEADYCQRKLDLLARHDLMVVALSNHRVGQAVGDPILPHHRALLPEYVWGDGDPVGVPQRAAEELLATARAAQKLGVAVVAGFTGSPLGGLAAGSPLLTPGLVEGALESFARRWHPILDGCRECGVRFALEVQPGQVAFDVFSAERTLQALGEREEFGFTLDPAALHWQGIDPAEFVRRFRARVYHVHVKDLALALNGRNGLLNGYVPEGDPRRGWDYRSPGRGGIDWEGLVRALNAAGYDGPLVVDWRDAGMRRDDGAEEACRFVKRLDFEPPPPDARQVFHEA
jgi:sugar phosphate isomerase/epimerase